MKDSADCKRCGGRREHDLRTGEVLPCDTCGEGSQPGEERRLTFVEYLREHPDALDKIGFPEETEFVRRLGDGEEETKHG